MLTLVIGGARSGKSRFAISLCSAEANVAFIATARRSDPEMESRIERHRRERPQRWTTVEEPLSLAAAVAQCLPNSDAVLVDCLTLWLSNVCLERRSLPFHELEEQASREIADVAKASTTGEVILVTNEVGCGVTPVSALGRSFQDLQGFTNQRAAREADVVYHITAGIPVQLKGRRQES